MSRLLFFLLIVFPLVLVACGDDESDNADTPTPEDVAPISADAGDDFIVTVGDVPTFDACRSTGDIENYRWTVLTPPEAVAEDAGKIVREVESNCRFTLGDAMVIEEVGDWIILLEVRRGTEIQTDTVTVTVIEPNGISTETPE